MKQLLPALLLLFLVTCATSTAPKTAPQVATEAPAVAPCNPALQLVDAALWIRSAAEYRASALQTYGAARRALDAALADKTWVGAAEETSNDPSQPPAIVLDLDETALNNIEFEERMIAQGKTYDAAIWKEWTASASAEAVPGAAEFLAYAKSRGVTPFYISNRDADEEPGTRANLQKLGFPLDANLDTVLLRGEQTWKSSDKSARRTWVADHYRLLLLFGDDLNDFTNARDKSKAERDAIVGQMESWWGTRWFILPNPMYGSFERAAIGSEGTPCELVQKKLEALRPR